MTQYIKATDAFHRLQVPYRKGLDWLFSGRLRGRRRGKHWEAELSSVQALERELGLVQDALPAGSVGVQNPRDVDETSEGTAHETGGFPRAIEV